MSRVALTNVLAVSLVLQGPVASAGEGISFGAGAEVAYDSNVWKLEEGKLEKPGTDTRPGEKYHDMESATDVVLAVHGRVDWETRAFATRKTRFRVEPGAAVFLQNPKRSYAEVEARLEQSVWKKGDVYLELGLVPSRFKKNYLVDAADTNANGRVTSSEKTYDAGVSTETGVRLGLRTGLTRSLSVDVFGGMSREGFAAPFENRSRTTAEGGAELELELGKRAQAELAYELVLVGTGHDEEVVVSDRQALVTPVDRSYTAHVLSPSFAVELADPVDLRAGYELVLRSYSSAGSTDPYRGREDVRHTASLGLRVKLAKSLRLDVGGSFARAIADRPNDPDAEPDEEDYERILGWVGLAAAF